MKALTVFALVAAVFTDARPVPHPLALVSRAVNDSDIYANWPTYDELPLHPSFPTKAAWGVWGESDELGSLNHIRNETILAAKSEIQLGRAFNLNLELSMPDPPLNTNRRPLIHAIQPFPGYQDDVITLNTQISTQFDGLRHFPYSTNQSRDTYQFYNDLITFDDIMAPGGSSTLGVQNAAQKGIAGRGILLDWARWMDSKNATFDAFNSTVISPAELDAVAKWQGLDPASFAKPGDFLIVRTGFTQQYLALSAHEQGVLPYGDDTFIGMEASDEMLRWLWDKKLALVGGDNPAFESLPLGLGFIDGVQRSLHQVFIGGWGQSIGAFMDCWHEVTLMNTATVEFLNLENLAAACDELKRYSFFFTIQNLNVVGGIASPPNAMAIL
ncbi:putative cyclase [Mycena venus]|uniref:Putative cyclase n=1 Tax=Mycena venus TaxID=2733690 RepID=A0A8H6XIK4_9AGAR|nr:putative cyclase [Mycena venus]